MIMIITESLIICRTNGSKHEDVQFERCEADK